MPPTLTPFLSSFRYTPLLSLSPLRTLFNAAPTPSQPTVTRYLLRPPFGGAVRECPTPIILVRALGLSSSYPGLPSSTYGTNEEDWSGWGGIFAEKGYTALEVDITAPTSPSSPGPDHPSPLKAMSSLLASQIRLLAIPFPPILVSSGESCLLTQMYVEDNPASGLVMLDPPTPDVPVSSSDSTISGIMGKMGNTVKSTLTFGRENSGDKEGGGADWELPVFTYEPAFPILILSSSGRSADISQSRLGQAASKGRGRGGKGVQLEQMVDGHRGEKNRIIVERWMDSCGF